MPSALDPQTISREVEDARELLQVGRPARAVRAFRKLERRLDTAEDDRPEVAELRARLLLGLAAADYEVSGHIEDALELLDRADDLASRAGADHLVVPIVGQRGLLLLRQGDIGRALEALDGVAGRLAAAPAYDRMTLLLNRGSLHLERGDVGAALRDLAECSRLADEEGATTLAWKARHNLGWAEFLAGSIPRAIATLEAAEALNPGDPHPVGMLDRARVLREAGLVAEADAALVGAAEAQRRAGLWQDLGETELARAGCAMAGGQLTAARTLARRARRRFLKRGNVRWVRRADVLLLRCDRASADTRSGPAAVRRLLHVAGEAEALAALCHSEGRADLAQVAALLAAESRLRVPLVGGDAGVPADVPTDSHVRFGPPAVRSKDPLATRLLTREVRALAAEADGDRRAAAAEVRRGLQELGSYQHSFGSLDLRTASAVHGSSLARLGLDLAVREGSAAEVLAVVERARAVSTRLPQVHPPSDPVSAELMTRLRRLEEETRTLEGDPAGGPALEQLRREVAAAQRAVRVRAWELEGGVGAIEAPPRASRLGRVAEATGTVFVSFARHRGRWLAVVVRGRRARMVPLAPVAEVQAMVTRVRGDLDALASPGIPAPLRDAVRHSLDLGLARLDAAVLGPLGVPGQPLSMSCSGDLLFLPWGLLPSRLGVATTVAPSATAWLRGQQTSRPEAPRVAAVAGPDLRLARSEALAVAGQWPGSTALVGGDATAQATGEALATHDLVHVSAHGRHRSDSPLFSSVRLADGALYAHEVDPRDGMAGCVVLSACDAGLATTRPGEEILGLAQVLLQLGARSVVAAVARVNDEVSAGLMVRTQQIISQGIDVSTSLAAATRETLDDELPTAYVSFGSSW